jgi:hypothetical protein
MTVYGILITGTSAFYFVRELIRINSGAHPASYKMGTGSFPGVKHLWHGVGHPSPSSTEVKGRVELYNGEPGGDFLAGTFWIEKDSISGFLSWTQRTLRF